MAADDPSVKSPLLTSQLSRIAQEGQQDDSQGQQASNFGGVGAFGGGNRMGMQQFDGNGEAGLDMAPGYAPHAPSGFGPFLSHLHEQGQIRTGRYTKDITLPDGQRIAARGLEPGELQDLAHDAYLKMAPEGRASWIQRENNQDLSDASTGKLGQNGASAPFNPGSMNDGNERSTRGQQSTHYGMDNLIPSAPSYQQPYAAPQMNADAASRGGWTSPTYAPRQMGDPNDTAKYGPRMTSQPDRTMPSQMGPPQPYNPQYGADRAGMQDAAANGTRFVSQPVGMDMSSRLQAQDAGARVAAQDAPSYQPQPMVRPTAPPLYSNVFQRVAAGAGTGMPTVADRFRTGAAAASAGQGVATRPQQAPQYTGPVPMPATPMASVR